MADGTKLQNLLVGAGFLPREMPHNYTYDTVREIVGAVKESDEAKLQDALSALSRLEISGPLPSAVFIKHHLVGEHETAVDRIIVDEESGERSAVLSYAEGEVPVKLDKLPRGVRAGVALRYQPTACKFAKVGGRRPFSAASRTPD